MTPNIQVVANMATSLMAEHHQLLEGQCACGGRWPGCPGFALGRTLDKLTRAAAVILPHLRRIGVEKTTLKPVEGQLFAILADIESPAPEEREGWPQEFQTSRRMI